MYPPRLYKYRDSSVLNTPTVHLFGSLSHTHTLLVRTHPHDVSTPWLYRVIIAYGLILLTYFASDFAYCIIKKNKAGFAPGAKNTLHNVR